MKKTLDYLMWGIIVAPLVYLTLMWNQLPETIPTHFGIDGKPNDYGSKWTLIILSAVSIGIYFLLRYLPQLDPRLNQTKLSDHYSKLILLVLLFLGATQVLIIQSALTQLSGEVFNNIVFVGVFLLFAGIGNYLNNIKSNYFVGIRTPWTLESETVWRKTHQMGAKLYFAIGIIGALGVVWLPTSWKIVWTMSLIFSSTAWILVYSYQVYKKEKNEKA